MFNRNNNGALLILLSLPLGYISLIYLFSALLVVKDYFR